MDQRTSLDQGCYTWRHNSVLANIIRLVSPKLSEGWKLYSDLPGYLALGGGSIPPNVLVTNLRPDIFVVNETSRLAIILFAAMCLRRISMALWWRIDSP